MSSLEFTAHTPLSLGWSDAGATFMTVDRLHQEPAICPKGNASDHMDRIAQSGMFSRLRRLNATGDVETGLGCRSTVFVYQFYADEPADRRALVGLRSKTSLEFVAE